MSGPSPVGYVGQNVLPEQRLSHYRYADKSGYGDWVEAVYDAVHVVPAHVGGDSLRQRG